MAERPAAFGITGFGYAFGEDTDVRSSAADYVSDPERVTRWGFDTFHRAPDGVTAVGLAARAAHAALERTGVAAGDLDLVVLAASEVPEYPNWDASAALARELGIAKVQTLLLNEGCAAGVTGLGLVAGLMAVQPELDRVLFVAVNRVSEFHRNRMTVNNAVHSDGAVAVVLRRGHPALRWLATEQFTDPELSDWFRTDYGGSVAPVAPAGWSSRTADPGHVRVQSHFAKNPARLREFGELLNSRLLDVIDGACKRAGLDRHDVAHVIYLNDSPAAIEELVRPLGLPAGRTNAAISPAHSHMGAADQLTSLGEQLSRGELHDDDVVALTGTSIGMRWYCTLVRV
ncbi:3-oxoacyl-[acyl-carrier-protein] synthase III C-terminal domain-containing protein [Winogradskya humida]|uniref:3-oxoacyl-[acyl-carrier-protein] synthase-3 n=1 Tax=Winogradskya humida TaxID=113566 RepID=A0ABQ3ZHT4_9ACTN|nr:3-oxoacyl-[acyl-carrier-protein] synthase III C-terminal domain-containing protein [Actinoplanes humidus]GIE17812.1 hypothetical protein Ahu01nite_009140 [Actinoplanes humidus]